MTDKEDITRAEEISAEVGVTDTGISAKITARVASTFDRLIGSMGASWIARNEGKAAIEAARADGEIRILNAKADAKVAAIRATSDAVNAVIAEKLKDDPDFAKRAMEHSIIEDILVPQVNREAVAQIALEDLRDQPSRGDEHIGSDSPDELSPEFIRAMRDHAGRADTDEARKLWARVLAGEVRAPGTFTPRIMRIMEELNPEVAELFSRVCAARLGSTLPVALMPKLNPVERYSLEESHLLSSQGFGLSLTAHPVGKNHYVMRAGLIDIVMKWMGVGKPSHVVNGTEMFAMSDGTPKIYVNRLTDAGEAVASLIPSDQQETARQLVDACAKHFVGWSVGVQRNDVDDRIFHHAYQPIEDKEEGANK